MALLAVINLGRLGILMQIALTVSVLVDGMSPSLGALTWLINAALDNLGFLGAVTFMASTFPLAWQLHAYKRGWRY